MLREFGGISTADQLPVHGYGRYGGFGFFPQNGKIWVHPLSTRKAAGVVGSPVGNDPGLAFLNPRLPGQYWWSSRSALLDDVYLEPALDELVRRTGWPLALDEDITSSKRFPLNPKHIRVLDADVGLRGYIDSSAKMAPSLKDMVNRINAKHFPNYRHSMFLAEGYGMAAEMPLGYSNEVSEIAAFADVPDQVRLHYHAKLRGIGEDALINFAKVRRATGAVEVATEMAPMSLLGLKRSTFKFVGGQLITLPLDAIFNWAQYEMDRPMAISAAGSYTQMQGQRALLESKSAPINGDPSGLLFEGDICSLADPTYFGKIMPPGVTIMGKRVLHFSDPRHPINQRRRP